MGLAVAKEVREPKCRITGKKASEIPEYVVGAEDYQITPQEFAVLHDSSYDIKTNTFVSPQLIEVYHNTVLLRR